MTTDEVDITLENLESAYSGGLKEIRIIHGIGEETAQSGSTLFVQT